VGNASHMKAVSGRKTDTKDAEWICDLHRPGLVKASFIPPRAQRELRELVGFRSTLIAERASEANRIAKVLEGGNIKLAGVVTDILGKSSRRMLAALAAGVDDPKVLADMAEGKLRNKHDDLLLAFHGRMTLHQRAMLGTVATPDQRPHAGRFPSFAPRPGNPRAPIPVDPSPQRGRSFVAFWRKRAFSRKHRPELVGPPLPPPALYSAWNSAYRAQVSSASRTTWRTVCTME